MPLTNAEKQRRYRERLKQDPEKFENYRKKNLERIKSKYKYKKVSELNDREKSEVRRKWREQKRQKKTENNTIETVTPTKDPEMTIEWKMWETVQHTYKKKTANDKNISMLTKKTTKTNKTGTVQLLIDALEADIPKFKTHVFNFLHQNDEYKNCKEHLDENEAAIHCDFSENYVCKMGTEVQSMHFGASKIQVTLHTGVIYCKETKQSFCTISPSNIHQPEAIWAHLIPILEVTKTLIPNLKKLYIFSDGPSSQYKQKKNFYLIKYYAVLYNIDISWSFFESGHGKGVADAIGGVVKRALDREVSYGKDIQNASDVYSSLEQTVPSVKCIYISENEIDAVCKLIPTSLKAVPGTMSIHEVIAMKSNDKLIYHRPLTCFCNGFICNCFDMKTHQFETVFTEKPTDPSTSANTDLSCCDDLFPVTDLLLDENVALYEEIECVSIDENFNSQVIDMEQHIEDNVATKVTVVNEEIDSVLTNENINNQVIDIEHNAEPNATTEITVCNEDIESIKENINSQVLGTVPRF
ncbi:unnamed protein product [Euphydryas editha]|uniref:Uncharacterized protein n=1 Tax=Euphydryas editha TaxID=104508 RepID=A0AAU9UB24_EUPED|nr:unnamed protein product [Euphydryas editha]